MEEPEPHSQSPKQQRTPRLKAHNLEPLTPQESPEGVKPPSPFYPLDHQPVSDWGEEMELLSPRSSIGGESPLKPHSVETSPEQKKGPEEPEEQGQTEGEEQGQSEDQGQSVPDAADEEAQVAERQPHVSATEEGPIGAEPSQATPSCAGEEEQNQTVTAEALSSD